jgi:tripartite-type tricarboxylate transporter receptor subunit TctC
LPRSSATAANAHALFDRFPEYYITSIGAFVPAGTPAPIIEKLNKAFDAASANKDVKDKMALAGTYLDVSPSDEFFKVVNEEIQKYTAVIKQFHIKIDG